MPLKLLAGKNPHFPERVSQFRQARKPHSTHRAPIAAPKPLQSHRDPRGPPRSPSAPSIRYHNTPEGTAGVGRGQKEPRQFLSASPESAFPLADITAQVDTRAASHIFSLGLPHRRGHREPPSPLFLHPSLLLPAQSRKFCSRRRERSGCGSRSSPSPAAASSRIPPGSRGIQPGINSSRSAPCPPETKTHPLHQGTQVYSHKQCQSVCTHREAGPATPSPRLGETKKNFNPHAGTSIPSLEPKS